ncbi:MAG: DUF1189 domain-containing protein [Clostridia bacterium]|nr:DUF1189 domain-containing protein [Clostridia bacterium]
MENNEEYRVVNINFFKKIWLSITKFERYPEMATEGVGRAISYLAKLMVIFSIVVVAGAMYNFNKTLNQGIQYIDENFSEINYEDGILKIKPKDEDKVNIQTDLGTLIIDTNTTDSEQIKQYENNIKNADIGVIWLNNKVMVYSNGMEEGYYYEQLANKFGISNFNKTDFMNTIQNNTKIYIAYFIAMFIATFIAYLIATLIDVLILSIFGVLTTFLLKIRIRYRAIFNMSVYALTISILLKMIYVAVNMFISFNIKYFDFMYSAIGYICLVASLFMVKADVIKQQIELMKIAEKQKEKEQEQDKEKEEKKKEDKEKDKDKESKEKKEKKEEKPEVDDNPENQGSQA